MPAISLPDMAKGVAEMLENVSRYCAAMAQARAMLIKGLVSADEYERIDSLMLQRCDLPANSIFRDIDLIIRPARANMSAQGR